jgi:hypothetical protein
MGLAERAHDVELAVGGVHRLEAQLGDPLVLSAPADARRRRGPAEDRAGAVGVLGAALVVADPAGAGGKKRFPDVVEGFPGDEDEPGRRGSSRGSASLWPMATASRSSGGWSSRGRRGGRLRGHVALRFRVHRAVRLFMRACESGSGAGQGRKRELRIEPSEILRVLEIQPIPPVGFKNCVLPANPDFSPRELS